MEINVVDSNFKEVVLDSKLPVMVDFWATWCGPCRMVAPIVEQLAKEYEGKAVIAKCNVEEAEETPVNYGIRNIPTLLFFKDGELKDKMVGSNTKEAIEASHEKVVETQEVVGQIKTVADEVTDQSVQMGEVFRNCESSINSISDNIEDSRGYFDNVTNDIEDIKVKITKKGFMFEDMNNVLEQIDPLTNL